MTEDDDRLWWAVFGPPTTVWTLAAVLAPAAVLTVLVAVWLAGLLAAARGRLPLSVAGALVFVQAAFTTAEPFGWPAYIAWLTNSAICFLKFAVPGIYRK